MKFFYLRVSFLLAGLRKIYPTDFHKILRRGGTLDTEENR